MSASSSSSFIARSTIDDRSSPYFMSGEEDPCTVLVSHLLDGNNYYPWKRLMEISLGAMGKLCFVDGTLAPPSEQDPIFPQWNRCDNIVRLWISNSCSKEIAGRIIFSNTAATMWKTLQEQYGQPDGVRIFELYKKIWSLNQGSLSVTAYFNRLYGMWHELDHLCPVAPCTCGAYDEIHSREKVMKFLMGLNDDFAGVRFRLLLMSPLPPLIQVFRHVIDEESSISVIRTSSELGDMNVSRGAGVSESSTPSESSARYTDWGNKFKWSATGRPICGYCKKEGHVKDKCYKLHGYPPG